MKKYKDTSLGDTHLEDENGQALQSKEEISEVLEKHISNIFDKQIWPKSRFENPPTSLKITHRDKIQMDQPFIMSELEVGIKQLKNNTSGGTTEILSEFLKNSTYEVRVRILRYFNIMFEQEKYPEEMQLSKFICLHKKGETTNITNYRTIATGCNLCKLYLKLICNRITNIAEQNNLLGNIQRGFRAGHRGGENIIILETVMNILKEQTKPHYIALLDITKAYDRVWREGLWFKLEKYGFTNKIINIIKKSYESTKAVVHYQNVKTDPIEIDLGLRQGGVLSPILFALYLADIGRELEEINSGVKIGNQYITGLFFADDMMLWGDKKQLQRILTRLGTYAQTWKIEFSGPKSQIIPLNHKPSDNKWHIGHTPGNIQDRKEVVIGEVNEGIYLGVKFRRKKQCFEPQYEYAIQKAWKNYWMIKRISNNLKNISEIAMKIWNIYAIPNIIYGLEYIAINDKIIEDIEKIQLSFIRSVFKLPIHTKREILYNISGVMPVKWILHKLRWNFLSFIDKGEEHRWSKIALKNQIQSAKDKGFDIKNTKIKNIRKDFWTSIIKTEAELSIGLVIGTPKLITDRTIREVYQNKQIEIKEKSEKFKYISVNTTLKDYYPGTGSWWLKAKANALMYKMEKCKCQKNLDLEHFLLSCDEINIQQIGNESKIFIRFCKLFREIDKNRENKNKLNWLLHDERNNTERRIIGEWVRERYEIFINIQETTTDTNVSKQEDNTGGQDDNSDG